MGVRKFRLKLEEKIKFAKFSESEHSHDLAAYIKSDDPKEKQLRLADGVPHVVVLAITIERLGLPMEGAVDHIDQISDLELVRLLQFPRQVQTGGSDQLKAE